MDPLSITAGIIAVLQFTETVIQYLDDAKGANEDRNRIRSELYGVLGMLYILRNRATDDEPGSLILHSLATPNGPIEQFKVTLELLANRLAPSKGWKKVGAVITWPFPKKEVKELLDTLERQKSLFILAQQNDHL